MNKISSRERDLIIGMVSLVIFVAIIFFMFGYAFHQLWQKHKQSTETSDDTHSRLPSQHHTEQDLEMTIITENVSYGPLKCAGVKLNEHI